MNATFGWGFLCGPGAADGWTALLPLLVPTGLLLCYVCAAARNPGSWPDVRTASFALGCLLIALALTPAALDWAAADMRGHMAQHLLLGMFAPLALVMGRPGTLFLRTVSTRTARRTVRLLATGIVRALIHPLVAMLMSAGTLYVVYLTPLGAMLAQNAWWHAWLLAHFVVAGSVFAWSIAGPDPAPHRPGHRVRLVALFLAGAAHTGLATYLGAFPVDLGPNDVEAAGWMLYGGDVAEGLLAWALFHSWRTAGRRPTRAAVRASAVAAMRRARSSA